MKSMLDEEDVPATPKFPTCPACLVSFKDPEMLKQHMLIKVSKLQAALLKLEKPK